MSNEIYINIPNSKNYKQLELSDIENLQGDLKQISKENLDKLKQEIIDNGFVFPFFTWQDKIDNKYYSIDGLHRKKALLSLKDDGYMIPQYYPVIEIDAKDEHEAAKRLLAFNSRYAEITQIGFELFIQKYNINIESLNIEIPEININIVSFFEMYEPELNPSQTHNQINNNDINKAKNKLDNFVDNSKKNNEEIICPKCGHIFYTSGK